jgi:hypothetical protein
MATKCPGRIRTGSVINWPPGSGSKIQDCEFVDPDPDPKRKIFGSGKLEKIMLIGGCSKLPFYTF